MLATEVNDETNMPAQWSSSHGHHVMHIRVILCCDGKQRANLDLAEEVASEAEWAEACDQPGPHMLIGQPDMRLFWRRCFGRAEEVAWDFFWSRFPKDLNRCTPHTSLSLYRVANVRKGNLGHVVDALGQPEGHQT